MLWWQSRRKGIGYGVLLVLACLPAVWPFFTPGYFWNANDARHDVYFIFEYVRAWRDGDWFPRWLPDMTFGLGYPLFNIYAPLAVQVGVGLYLLGLEFTQAVEGVFVLSVFLSALAMFGFLRGVVGEEGAFVAAVAYVYAPYHLFDMYQRAAMAESFALVWIPLVLWGVRAAVKQPSWGRVVGLGVAYAGLMLTSNLVAVLVTPVAVGYGLWLSGATAWTQRASHAWARHVQGLLAAAGGGLVGLGLSAWFWLPAVLEFQYVNQAQWYGGYYDYRWHFVYFFQLFSPHWGFGISVPGPDDVISYQIGLAPYFLALAGLSALFSSRARGRLTGIYMGFVAVASLFLTTAASAWVWESVPGVSFAQFPWRYLMLTIVALSTLVGLGVSVPGEGVRPWLRKVAPWVSALLLIGGSASYLYVEVVDPLPEQGPPGLPALMRFQASEDEMTGVTVFAKEIPRWTGLAELMARGQDVRTRVDYAHVPEDGSLVVRTLRYRSSEEVVWVEARRPGLRLVFNRQMYPGWTAYIYDETGTRLLNVLSWQELEVTDPYGQVTVPLPQGRHVVVLRFEDTPPRRAGRWLSLATLVLLAVTGLWCWPRRKGWPVKGRKGASSLLREVGRKTSLSSTGHRET